MRQRGAFLVRAVFAFIIGWAMPLNAQTVDIEAAKKEGKVVVYAAVPPQTMKVINDPFEKKFGIRVDYWRASTTGILERALNEWRVGKPGFDVVEGNKGPQLILKGEGVFDKFLPASAGKVSPAISRSRRNSNAVALQSDQHHGQYRPGQKRRAAENARRSAAAEMERKDRNSRSVAPHHNRAVS